MSCFITNKRHNNRYDRLEVFKYTLHSYKNIQFEELFFFILLDAEYNCEINNLNEFIYSNFNNISKTKIHIINDRYYKQIQWIPFMQKIKEKYGPNELIWFTQNDDHVFVDFNMEILNEGIELLKLEKNNRKSIYYSHWPEIVRMSGKYETPTLIGNYVKFNNSLLDSIQIFNSEFLYYIFIEYNWKNDHIRIDSILNELTSYPSQENILNQTIYIPLREMVRHFDGYDHVNMDKKSCPPLILPINTFNYSNESLINKMTAYHNSAWTFNNNFIIPQIWIDINLSLHSQNITYHTVGVKDYCNKTKHYKAIILILASNESPITKNSRRIWKKYMNMDPTFKVLFVYGKLDDQLEDQDENDLIYNDISESYPVTFHKTFEAMKFIDTNFSYEYFVRTNISTFWDFKQLNMHLDVLPRTNCYSGDGPFRISELNYHCLYVSGTDTIVTREMIKSMVSNRDKINFNLVEDAVMGQYFYGVLNVPILPNRICFFEDILDTDDTNIPKIELRIQDAINENKDHYRVKNYRGDRLSIDHLIYKILLKHIYNIEI